MSDSSSSDQVVCVNAEIAEFPPRNQGYIDAPRNLPTLPPSIMQSPGGAASLMSDPAKLETLISDPEVGPFMQKAGI